jgi:hypothetical protein
MMCFRERTEKRVQVATCSELDGVPNIRFFLPGEVYALGVASALDVGDTVVTPAVLVVADQEPVVISRQCRLSGACCANFQKFQNQKIYTVKGSQNSEHIIRIC